MDFITNSINQLITFFSRFATMCQNFFQSIIDFFNSVWSIISTLRFWLKSLFSWLRSFIDQVLSGQLFSFLWDWFSSLTGWLGFGATFISWFLLLVFLRIIIAFVFKIFRFNVDYPEKIVDTYPNDYKWRSLS